MNSRLAGRRRILRRPLLRNVYSPRRRPVWPALGASAGLPWLTAWRRAKLLGIRRAISWRKHLLEQLQEQLTAFDEVLTATTEGADGGYDTSGEYTGTAETSEGGGGGEASTEMTRRDAFFRVFTGMKGEKAEFTADGYPRVLEVNDRLEMLGQDRATQKEVVGYYDEWRESGGPSGKTGSSSGSTAPSRRQSLFRVFDIMKGERAEFTVEGYPKVLEVNDRLEAIGLERTNHQEVVTYFDEWKEAGPSEGGSTSSSGAGLSRSQALFLVFDGMKGEKSEFNVDGSPKVGEVNDRLEALGQKPSTREEIDKYFDRWKKQ